MDITSYLLGKKAGGGGSTGLDWSAIGYSGTPQSIIDGYNYAVEIMNNWDDTAAMDYKFMRDYNLVFMPLVDITKANNLSNMFQYCSNLIGVANLDYSKAIYLDYMFHNCNGLKEITNFNVTGRIQNTFMSCIELETIQGNMKPVSLRNTFNGCTNLKNIPYIDCSACGSKYDFQGSFQNCPNLTDTSLDNILQSIISATSYPGTKTLAYAGFNSTDYPSSRIQALPHYQNFIDAGWAIGY